MKNKLSDQKQQLEKMLSYTISELRKIATQQEWIAEEDFYDKMNMMLSPILEGKKNFELVPLQPIATGLLLTQKVLEISERYQELVTVSHFESEEDFMNLCRGLVKELAGLFKV